MAQYGVDQSESIERLVNIMNTKLSYVFANYLKKSYDTIYFPSPIELNPNRSYECALIYTDVYNSLKNITTLKNKFYYATTQSAQVWKTITLIPGCYQFSDINSYIQTQIRSNESIPTTTADPISLTANIITKRIDIKIVNNYSIDFTQANTFKDMLGFDSILVNTNGTTSGIRSAQVVSYNAIVINSDLTTNSYSNGTSANFLHSYSAFTAPTGFKLFEKPNPPIYLPVTKRSISSVIFWVTNEKGELLDFDGETITVTIHLRQI